MRIGILGTRGIPARYGGFETFAEELSVRLARRGHAVEVHCRRGRCGAEEIPGVERVILPALYSKHLETLSHSALSVLYLLLRRLLRRTVPDVVLVCNGANAPIVWVLRLLGIPFCLNVDGIERKRGKWGTFGALWYHIGEWFSARFANRVVSDAKVIQEYYESTYQVESSVITYGFNTKKEELVEAKLANPELAALREELRPFELTPDGYILYVSRLEPENNAHLVIEAYQKLADPGVPLVIVGNAPYAAEYIESLQGAAAGNRNIRFYGFQFSPAYEALQLGARVYIQATEVGGTHPALVEAMGFANCIVANRTPENEEVLGDAGRFYRLNDAAHLAEELRILLVDEALRLKLRRSARLRAEERYSWERLTLQYEELFLNLKEGSSPNR